MTPLTIEEVRQVKTGDKLLVTWSGGNGPHEYVAKWEHGDLVACLVGYPDGYPGTIMRRGDTHLINRVWKSS